MLLLLLGVAELLFHPFQRFARLLVCVWKKLWSLLQFHFVANGHHTQTQVVSGHVFIWTHIVHTMIDSSGYGCASTNITVAVAMVLHLWDE